ncbi:MAG TPA: FeoB-associated Cys-rich membrane protein [Desulfosarcina sp.]|nr:FeoB-associated Cys-rich membrane protein [Desulfosarcina sp.]
MQTILVILIVVAAAAYVGRIFIRGLRRPGACACGCSCCSLADSCADAADDTVAKAPESRPDP